MEKVEKMHYPSSEIPFVSNREGYFVCKTDLFLDPLNRFILPIFFLFYSWSSETQANKNTFHIQKRPCSLFVPSVLMPLDFSPHVPDVNRVSKRTPFLRESALVLDHQVLGREGQEIFDKLDRLMVGHQELKMSLARSVQRAATGTHSGRRVVATYLLLGLTGSGKTMTAEALAEALTGDARSYVKIPGGEFQESHEVSKIIGAPPGYIGHSETPAFLSQEILSKNTSQKYNSNVVLVDELEKAHVSLQKLLLEIMENRQLRSGENVTLDFSQSILILTSNLGQSEIQGILNDRGPTIGFSPSSVSKSSEVQKKQDEIVRKAALKATERFLSPEFRNRIDHVFVFSELAPDQIEKALMMNLAFAQRRSFLDQDETRFVFFVRPEAKELLLRRDYRPEFGARSLRRAIDHWIVEPLTNLLSSSQIRPGDLVEVSVSKEGTDFLFLKRNTESLTNEQLELLYFRIYGESLPTLKATKDLSDSLLDLEDHQDRFLFELHLLDQSADEINKFRRIENFLNTYTLPLSNEQFLQLYHRIPKPALKIGYNNSSFVLEQLEKFSLGQLQKGGFGSEGGVLESLAREPASLRHLVFLATRTDSGRIADVSQAAHMKQVGDEIQKMLPEFFIGLADIKGNKKLLESLQEFFQNFISSRIKGSAHD
ncbi:MAG: AAA family ATPase [Bdellovibrio sp.]